MSYDLDLFSGDIEDDEEGWAPLDPVVAAAAMSGLPGITSAGDEWYWPVGVLTLTLQLAADEGQALRSIGVSVNISASASTSTDLHRDYRTVLEALLPLADRLGARLFDHQLDGYVEPEAIDAAVAGFA